jgi:CheY-like chemotaxis protein
LQRARDEALAASRAKDDFLAALSHELRTPLSPVLLLASESAADAKLPARVRKDFATIRKCVELEARLIDDLLDLTRITRGKLALERAKLDLAVVLQDALSTIRADLDQKQIELVVEDIPDFVWVWGDPVRLQQVFWNVLKNAVKFTPWGGRVSVGSRIDPAKETIVIEVTDSGIGITPAELARVFEAFSQGDHANTGGSHRFGGLGLGLAISRRVVELHDGKITAESAGRDHGATFRVELPLFDSASTKAVQDTTTSSSNESHVVKQRAATMQFESAIDGQVVTRKRPAALLGRILLVEDHAPTRIALEQLLIRRNYAVRSAASVADARELAKREKFAILISDIGLPDGSGYDLMSEFRKAYGMVGVSLTGYGTEEDVSRSQSAGFVRHLTKPIRMQSLDEALANLPLVMKAN